MYSKADKKTDKQPKNKAHMNTQVQTLSHKAHIILLVPG